MLRRVIQVTNWKNNWQSGLQLIAVLVIAMAMKFYYSTASVNELRWILAPTTWLVEFATGTRFAFESHAGYMSSDHTFLIAASCAGVNFLLTAFLMLSLWKLWRDRGKKIGWSFIASAAASAYFATIVANTARIAIALQLRKTPLNIGLSPDQLHRFEGILVYFGFLLALFLICEWLSERTSETNKSAKSNSQLGWLRKLLLPLFVYYAVTLGIPLANGAFRKESGFIEHALFVLITPILLIGLAMPLSSPKITLAFERVNRRMCSGISGGDRDSFITACRRMWGAARRGLTFRFQRWFAPIVQRFQTRKVGN